MSTSLESAIQAALKSQGDNTLANKVYLEFMKANFIVPTEKFSDADSPEVLYLQHESYIFLPVFTSMTHLDHWAADIQDQINILKLSGVDLLKGIGENIYVSLDIGSPNYKEFNPAEIARMRSMVMKLFKN